MLQVSLAEIAVALEQASSSVSAPEAHGCLAGGLCADPGYSLQQWLDEVVPDESQLAVRSPDQPLTLLFDVTADALRGDDFEFNPLLPDDQNTLLERATALAQWCQGFLYGLGTGDLGALPKLPEEVDEVMRDLEQIGKAAIEPGDFEENSEEDEESYAQVVEYVRVSVQLVFDELDALRAQQSRSH
jgi:uncharacterized protein